MLKRLRLTVAVVVVMLTVEVSAAKASEISLLEDGVDFSLSNGDTLTGTVTFQLATYNDSSVYYFPPQYYMNGNLSLNGDPFQNVSGPGTFSTTAFNVFRGPLPSLTEQFYLYADISNLPNVTYLFDGQTGVNISGGTTTILAEETIDPTPLPPALPMFACAIAGLAVVGWRRRSL